MSSYTGRIGTDTQGFDDHLHTKGTGLPRPWLTPPFCPPPGPRYRPPWAALVSSDVCIYFSAGTFLQSPARTSAPANKLTDSSRLETISSAAEHPPRFVSLLVQPSCLSFAS